MTSRTVTIGMGVVLGACLATVACRPSDVLSVPPPAGVIASSSYNSQTGAETMFDGAVTNFFNAVAGGSGLMQWTGLLSDEFIWSYFTDDAYYANVDARVTTGITGFDEPGDATIQAVLAARSALILALPALVAYEPASGKAHVGEAYALMGYAELLLAEGYCAGVPLSQIVQSGGIQYGQALTMDSLLGTAESHFDSATAYANGNDSVTGLAAVGLGRALLDRGQYSAAATAVAHVPTGFVYNTQLEPGGYSNGEPYTFNLYDDQIYGYECGFINVGDREGVNGLNFVSSQDPRLVVDSTMLKTCDGGTWYFPTKFGVNLSYVPLATGVEAALITAEAVLQASPSAWLTDLNALRAVAPSTYLALASGLAPLADPGTDTGRVSLMFRERAFWLFGTGTRLGDLRRLIRQYGRDQSAVFPTGPYSAGPGDAYASDLPIPIPTYGTDVSITLPTGTNNNSTNPNYKGCLTSTKTA